METKEISKDIEQLNDRLGEITKSLQAERGALATAKAAASRELIGTGKPGKAAAELDRLSNQVSTLEAAVSEIRRMLEEKQAALKAEQVQAARAEAAELSESTRKEVLELAQAFLELGSRAEALHQDTSRIHALEIRNGFQVSGDLNGTLGALSAILTGVRGLSNIIDTSVGISREKSPFFDLVKRRKAAMGQTWPPAPKQPEQPPQIDKKAAMLTQRYHPKR